MKLAISVFLAAVLASTACPTSAAPSAANNPQDLINMENGWAKAVVARDAAALSRIVAPDWTGLDHHGKIMNRAAMIKEIVAGDEKLTSMISHDMHVRFLGNNHAIVQGLDNESGVTKGKKVKEVYSWTDVYEKRGGQWVAIASQMTPVK